MKRYARHNATTARTMYLRKNIARSRRRATLVGLLYLVGAIVMAAAACLPLLGSDYALVPELTTFYTTLFAFNFEGAANIVSFAICALYALLLLVVVVNVFKALGKLGWLFKTKGSREYGFNRNAYAMEDMSRAFSGSFSWLVITYVLIGLLAGLNPLSQMIMLVIVAAGAVIRLACGFFGAKVRYYDLENGQIVEQKRLVGRFACLLRNVFQFAAVVAILYLLDFAALNVEVLALLGEGESAMIPLVFFAEVAVILCSFVLITHAAAATEYSMEGIYGSGMKNFRVFAFFAFLAAAAGTAICMMQSVEAGSLMYVAIVAFVSFVIEIIMRKYPRLPEDVEAGRFGGEPEFSFDTFSRLQQSQEQNYARPQQPMTYIM